MDYLQVGASWLHLVATVVLLGYVFVIGAVVLPILRRDAEPATAGVLMAAFERRAFLAIVASLVAFLATGAYLTVSDARYGGVGDVTGSNWATIITLKHVVVAVLVGLGLYADGLIARRIALADAADQPAALGRLTVVVWLMIIAGALVLLLTAVAADAG